MISIIDYGMGNLRSVQKALEKTGAEVQVTKDIEAINLSEKIILPGVGAIKPAMERLDYLGLIPAIKKSINEGKPFLGICLGFQLLFEKSDEGGNAEGLGILKGAVDKFLHLKIPQIGWNQLNIKLPDCPLFTGVNNLENVYFCHSYFVNPCEKNIIATSTEYGIEFTSSVWKKNIFGVQFHPEKSQTVGLKILKNFIHMPQMNGEQRD